MSRPSRASDTLGVILFLLALLGFFWWLVHLLNQL